MLFISSITPPKNGTWIINLVMRLFFLPANKSVKELPIPEDNVGKAGVVTGGGVGDPHHQSLLCKACASGAGPAQEGLRLRAPFPSF